MKVNPPKLPREDDSRRQAVAGERQPHSCTSACTATAPPSSWQAAIDHSPRMLAQRQVIAALGGGRASAQTLRPPAVVQRTSIVVGYKENDAMFSAALDALPAPNPIHTFTEKGAPVIDAEPMTESPEPASSDTEKKTSSQPSTETGRLKAKYKTRPADTSTLHLIAHGSPGSVADVDLDTFLASLQSEGHFTDETKAVNLYSCYAMMRKQGLHNKSAALKVAEWIQSNIPIESEQAVTFRTGYTTNSTGLFSSGAASYQPLDLRGIVDAHPLQTYLHYRTRQIIKSRFANSQDKTACWSGVKDELTFAAGDLAEAIVALQPERAWAAHGERSKAEEFNITGAGIDKGYLLSAGYTIADVTKDNFESFPQRFIQLNNFADVGQSVIAAIEAAAQKLVTEFAPKAPLAQPVATGFNMNMVSPGSGTFTWTGSTGQPTFGGMPPQ